MITKNSKTVDYLGTNTLIYRDSRAIERVGAVWGVALKLPGGYKSLQGALDALGALRATPPPTLAHLALDGAPSTLSKRVQEHAGDYAAHMMIEAQQGEAKRTITDKMKHEMDSPAMFDHLLKQLPLAEVEQRFVSAVDSLGHSVYNLSAAVDKDAQATADLRESGRKLAALQYLLTRNSEVYSSALYVDIAYEYETLYYSKDGFGRISEHYDQDALDQHQSLVNLRGTALDTGSTFTAVALGAKPGVKFSLAKNYEQLRERSQRMKQAGRRNLISNP